MFKEITTKSAIKVVHHSDADGWCSAAIINAITGRVLTSENFIETNYRNMDDVVNKINDGDFVILVDVSFTETTKVFLDEIIKKSAAIWWIDHHTSSVKLCETYLIYNHIPGIRREELSGAPLTYICGYSLDIDEVLSNDIKPYPYVISLVDDHDRWKHQISGTREFNMYTFSRKHEELLPGSGFWEDLIEGKSNINDYIKIGEKLLEFDTTEKERYCKLNAFESTINGIPCVVINRKCNSSIFGELYNHYPIVVTYGFDGFEYGYSLFSNRKDPNIDCSIIAEQYGGGGHKGAAGFATPENIFSDVSKNKKINFKSFGL